MRSHPAFRLFLILTFCAMAIPSRADIVSAIGPIVFVDPFPSGLTLPITPNTMEVNGPIRVYYLHNVPGNTSQMDFCQPGAFTSYTNAPTCLLPSNFVGDLAYVYFDPVGQ